MESCDQWILPMDRPTEKHLHAVKRIFRYLRGTVNWGLWYSKDSAIALTAFADADHVGCQDTRRSTSGSMQLLGDRLVSWSSKRQKSAAISSTESDSYRPFWHRSKVLSNVDDRWAWDLNGGGDFCVKDARDLVDEVLLPKENVATRWIKTIHIKVNVFAWKLHLDRLPTRSNLLKRGIQVQSSLCPICNVLQEDTSHLFFSCDVALAISRLICQWWNVSWSPVDSYSGWLEWFNSIRLGSKLKGILEGVFYVSWWCLWNFRNQLLFASKKPRKETLFDDVVSRSFIWSNSRCNLKFTWDCWLQHPYLIAL
ncbi:RNA-directed DNA polymerase, eukaryota [Tanacetum coccineum]